MTDRLARTWAFIAVLTLVAMGTSIVNGGATFDLTGAAAVLLLSGIKAGAVLRNFLELRHAPAGWQAVFYVYLAAIGIIVFAAHAAQSLTRF